MKLNQLAAASAQKKDPILVMKELVRNVLALHRIPLGLLVACIFASCSTIAPYDPIVDDRINEIATRTEMILAKADLGQLAMKDQQDFFSESIGTVRATKNRASLVSKNEEETQALDDLEARLQALAERDQPLRSSLATGLKATLLDLQQIQLAKKRSKRFSDKLRKNE